MDKTFIEIDKKLSLNGKLSETVPLQEVIKALAENNITIPQEQLDLVLYKYDIEGKTPKKLNYEILINDLRRISLREV